MVVPLLILLFCTVAAYVGWRNDRIHPVLTAGILIIITFCFSINFLTIFSRSFVLLFADFRNIIMALTISAIGLQLSIFLIFNDLILGSDILTKFLFFNIGVGIIALVKNLFVKV